MPVWSISSGKPRCVSWRPSATGVAGPTGGTPEKPVGLVYLGLATSEGTETRRLDIGAEQPRLIIQSRAAKSALNWARLKLLGER
jgi:nicotinamide-nucleotide amidase